MIKVSTFLEAFTRRSVSSQIISTAAFLVILSAVVLNAFFVFTQKAALYDETKKCGLALATTIAGVGTQAAQAGDYENLLDALRSTAGSDDLVYVIIRSGSGEILAQTDRGLEAKAAEVAEIKEGTRQVETHTALWKPDGYSRIYDVVVPAATKRTGGEYSTSDANALADVEAVPYDSMGVSAGTDVGDVQIGMSLRRADGAVRSSAFTAGLLTLCLMVLTALAARKAAGIILDPFARLGSSVQSVGSGDLSAAIPARSADDEVGRLCAAFVQMKSRLEDALSQIRSIALIAEYTVSDLKSYSRSQTSGAQEQSTSLAQTSSVIEEMATASNHISENAKKVAELADQSFSGMETIRTNAQEGSGKIRALREKSQNIGEVIEIIDDITTQTNLLALNASIEAARAGAAGAGFAVVAAEIRKLATNVAGSTEQIRKITTEIREASSDSVAASENVSKSVDTGIELSKNTAESAVQIHTATQQQKVAADQIVTAIKEMVDIAQRANTGSVQLTETADRLAGAAEEQKKLLEYYGIG